MDKKVRYGLLVPAVVIVGVLAVATLWKVAGGSSADKSFETLTGTGARLAKARTARITFTGELNPVVAGPSASWGGTTMISFAGKPAWLSTYDKVASPSLGPEPARRGCAGDGVALGRGFNYKASFTVAEFGVAITVPLPVQNQISDDRIVRLKP